MLAKDIFFLDLMTSAIYTRKPNNHTPKQHNKTLPEPSLVKP